MTSAQKHLPGTTSPLHATTANLAFRSRTGALIGLAAVLGLALAGCGPATGTGSGTPAPASATAGSTPSTMESVSPSASVPSSTAPATSDAPATTAAPATSDAPATTAGAALCTAASLSGSLDDSGGGAAGHIYMKLVLKNTSGTTCILDGYPGVSLVTNGSITPIGAPAERDPAAPSQGPIPLAPGRSASAVLRYTQAGLYQDCQPVQADGVMVYPPSATDQLVVAHPLTACGNANDKLLLIGAFQP